MKARALNLTNREMRAWRDEINRQTAQNVKKLSQDLQALILWQLRTQLGFGKKRLLRFQKEFVPAIKELEEYYKLKHELGIDVAELNEMIGFKINITD